MFAHRARRRGLAPLELVLVFPLLVTLVMGLLWVGKAGSARFGAITDARGVAWKQRDDAKPGKVLKLDHDATESVVEDARANPVKGRAPFSDQEWFAEALNGVPFDPWAHNRIRFEKLPPASREIRPHRELLALIGRRNPETLATYNRLIGRLGAGPIDPGKNSEVQSALPPEKVLTSLRGVRKKLQSIDGMRSVVVVLGTAEVELGRLAVQNPYGAAWYAYEALVVALGANAALELEKAVP